MKKNASLRILSTGLAAAALAAAVLPATGQAQGSPSAPSWQRNAVPFYDTVHALQGIYRHWALPRAQDFDRHARALAPALATLCQAPAADGKSALDAARSAWQATTRAWEQLSAVSVGPVIARRSQRAIDFTPTRPALIEKAIAAQPQGAGHWRILFREVLPNVLPAMVSIALLGMAIAIVAEGGLAILGASVDPPTSTWGTMISTGRVDLEDAPFIVWIPVAAIFLTAMSLNYLGDVIRDRFDVRESAL